MESWSADDPAPSVLPPHELTSFLLTVEEALDLGGAGETLDGFRCLLGGLEQAREAREMGEPWAGELIGRYELALRRYAEVWGLRVE